jgi:hypothetical protein
MYQVHKGMHKREDVSPSACFISNYQQDIYEIWYSDLQQKLLGELSFGTLCSKITPTLHDSPSTNGPIHKKI